ncbi:MAG: septum formation family protein, partial [Actinomycetota bacterium]|nr:septum formation family protein [Actinomycetota bacterium]
MRRLTMGLVAAFLTAACSGGDGPMREAGQPGVVRSGSLSVFELMVGDCLADPSEAAIPSEVDALDAVPCSQPHRLEVFAVVAVETGDDLYPGESALTAQADAGCLGEFPGYTSVEYFAQSA